MAGPASSLDVLEVLEALQDTRLFLKDISERLARVEKFLKLNGESAPATSGFSSSSSCSRGSFQSPTDSPRGAWVLQPEE